MYSRRNQVKMGHVTVVDLEYKMTGILMIGEETQKGRYRTALRSHVMGRGRDRMVYYKQGMGREATWKAEEFALVPGGPWSCQHLGFWTLQLPEP